MRKTPPESAVKRELLEIAKDKAEAYGYLDLGPDFYAETLKADAEKREAKLNAPVLAKKDIPTCVSVKEANPFAGDGVTSIVLADTAATPTTIAAYAHEERLKLADDAGCLLASSDVSNTIQPQDSLERMLGHQLAAAHSHSMRLLGRAGKLLEKTEGLGCPASISEEAARLYNAATRLMSVYQNGVMALLKKRGGGRQQVTVVHQHLQVSADNVAVAGNITKGGGDGGRG